MDSIKTDFYLLPHIHKDKFLDQEMQNFTVLLYKLKESVCLLNTPN